jgi:hypothetical protein
MDKVILEVMANEYIDEKVQVKIVEDVCEEKTADEMILADALKVQENEIEQTNLQCIGHGLLLFACVFAVAGALVFSAIFTRGILHSFSGAPLYAYILGQLAVMLAILTETMNQGGIVTAMAKAPELAFLFIVPAGTAVLHLARNRVLPQSKKRWWWCVLGLGAVGVVPLAVPAYLLTQVRTMSILTKLLGILSAPAIGYALLRLPAYTFGNQFVAALPMLQLVGPAIVLACFASCMVDAFKLQKPSA